VAIETNANAARSAAMSAASSRPNLLLGEVRDAFVGAFILGHLLPSQKVRGNASEIGASGKGGFFLASSNSSSAHPAVYSPSSPVISFLVTREAPSERALM
jgi:hypothetical protein